MKRASLRVEELESRCLLSHLMSVDILDGFLVVEGSDFSDSIRVAQRGDTLCVTASNAFGRFRECFSVEDVSSGTVVVYGNDGNDRINLSSLKLDSVVDGGFGDDRITGGRGQDYLFGHYGDDVLSGGAGDDYLDGEFGDDSVRGGSGDDVILGGLGEDTLRGDSGDDLLVEFDSGNLINGGSGYDILLTDSLDNVIRRVEEIELF
jgi:Ca2+-binding RTX toxin-like protein